MQKRKILDWWQAMTPLAPFGAHALRSPASAQCLGTIFNFDYFTLIVILVAASLLAFC